MNYMRGRGSSVTRPSSLFALGVLVFLTGCSGAARDSKCGTPVECYNSALQKLEETRQLWANERVTIVPIGTVVAMALPVSPGPAGAPSGWLLCDGTEHPAKDYPKLSAALLALSDAYKGTTPTHFKVPDHRGYFLRGHNPNGPADDKGVRRVLGAAQADDVGPHVHSCIQSNGRGKPEKDNSQSGGYVQEGNVKGDACTVHTNGGVETRPKNISVNFLIKADLQKL